MIRIYPLNGLLMQTEQDLRAQLAERLALPPLPEDWQAALAAQLSGRGAGGLILLEFARRMPDGCCCRSYRRSAASRGRTRAGPSSSALRGRAATTGTAHEAAAHLRF